MCFPLPTMFAPELRALWWKRRFVGWRLVETSCCLAVSLGILATWLIITTDYSSRKKWVRFVFPPAFTWLSGQPWKKKLCRNELILAAAKGSGCWQRMWTATRQTLQLGLNTVNLAFMTRQRMLEVHRGARLQYGAFRYLSAFFFFSLSFSCASYSHCVLQNLGLPEREEGWSWEIFCRLSLFFLISCPVKIPFLSSHAAPQRSAWWKQHWARRRRVLGVWKRAQQRQSVLADLKKLLHIWHWLVVRRGLT